MEKKPHYIVLALLAALLYAISTPFSKALLRQVPSTILAALLYFGAGIGVGLLWLCRKNKKELRKTNLTRKDLPYTIGMILLDIAAPVCLMAGLTTATAANVSLLNNFEIVATSLIAFAVFKEKISGRLWAAIALITAASLLLSFENASSLQFSRGSLFVLLACVCWGLENNCTRKISDRNIYEIVVLKGIFSGLGSLLIGLLQGQRLSAGRYIGLSLLLGFVAYGLSIFVYIAAQRGIGAAKTSAYYAVAPFLGALLSLLVLHERPGPLFYAALAVMAVGTGLVSWDTIVIHHKHVHDHIITDQDGNTYVLRHSHYHNHLADHVGEHHHHHIGLHGIA